MPVAVPFVPEPASRTVASPDESLRQRYRDPILRAPEAWNATLDGLLAHRSVRAFLPTPVPDTVLATLIAAAQSAASSSNLQVWSVVAVRDPARKSRLAEFAGSQQHIRDCPLFLVWLADLARLDRIGAAQDMRLEGLDYLETLLVGVIDATLAAQNAVVALESLGLGAVYIGGIRNRPEDVAAELALPPRIMPVFGLCVGHPDPSVTTGVKPRLPQAAVLHHEQYKLDGQATPIASYDAALHGFQQEQGMRPADWSRQSADRVRTPAALSGRHRMRDALINLGFPLR